MLLRDLVMTNFNPTKLALEDVDAHLRYHRFNFKFACADSSTSVEKERERERDRERERERDREREREREILEEISCLSLNDFCKL